MGNFTIPQAVFDIRRPGRPHLSIQLSHSHRTSSALRAVNTDARVIYEGRFLYFLSNPSSPTWTFRSDPCSPFSRPSLTRPRVSLPGSLQSIHGCSDDSTRRREQSQPLELVFDIRYQLSCEHCEHLAYLTLTLTLTLNSLNLQFQTKASVLSCICVVIILIWICVRPAFVHVFIILMRCCTAECILV
jgi:hypothetical protein